MLEDVKRIAEEPIIAYKRAYTRGIQTRSGDNVGARMPGRDLMIVRANSSSFIDSTPEGFVVTDFDRNLVEGGGKPTKEVLLHGLPYRICPKVNAVAHTHSPCSITWTPTRKALKRTTWHARLKIGADSPTLDVPTAVVKKECFPMVEEIHRENSDLPGFLLVDHDLVAVGKDAINAEHTAELIEETAQMVILRVTVSKLSL